MVLSPRSRGAVESAVRRSISNGQLLHTPSRHAPFVVAKVDDEGVVILLGEGRGAIRLSWDCLEGLIPFIISHGGEVPIGGRYQVEGNPGTLDEHLKGCVKTTTAGWVAAMLEEAEVLQINRVLPATVRLIQSPG